VNIGEYIYVVLTCPQFKLKRAKASAKTKRSINRESLDDKGI
jgi:hypothetical protein